MVKKGTSKHAGAEEVRENWNEEHTSVHIHLKFIINGLALSVLCCEIARILRSFSERIIN